MQNLHFFKSLYASAPSGFIALTTLRHQTHWMPIDDLASSLPLIEKLTPSHNIYYGLGVQKAPAASGRGLANDVWAIPAVVLDIDINDTGKYADSKNTAQSLNDIKAHWEMCGLPAPSAIVSTGNGYHFYLLLNTAYMIHNDDERKRISNLLKNFNAEAKQRTKWKLDNIGDLARVLRMPDTYNRKDPENPKKCEIIELNEGVRYSIADLEAYCRKPEKSASKSIAPAPRKNNTGTDKSDLPDFESVKTGCAFIQHTVDDADTLSEPEWYAALSIAGYCENGDAIAQEISSPYLGYDAGKTTEKLQHAREFPPRTCANIANDLGFNGCESCIFKDRFASPIKLGFERPQVVKLAVNTVLDYRRKQYVDWSTSDELDGGGFNLSKKSKSLKIPSQELAESELTLKVNGVDFRPNNPKIMSINNYKVLNTWVKPQIAPQKGDCSDILNHFRFLFSDNIQYDHVLNYFAHMVQKPDVKINHALMIIGIHQGTGKSMAIGWMCDIFGRGNVTMPTNELLTGRFKSEMANKLYGICEEIMGDGRLSTYNSLKPWITDETVTVERKGIDAYLARTPVGWTFTSNHLDPFMLEESDRRLAVLTVDAKPMPSEHYKELMDKAKAQLPMFYQFLLDRDLKTFDPKAPPPMTSGKKEMIDLGRSPVDTIIRQMYDDKEGPFRRDMATADDVDRAVKARLPNTPNIRMSEVIKSLKRLGAIQYQGQVRHSEHRIRVWIWSNHEEWLKSEPKKIAEAYKPFSLFDA